MQLNAVQCVCYTTIAEPPRRGRELLRRTRSTRLYESKKMRLTFTRASGSLHYNYLPRCLHFERGRADAASTAGIAGWKEEADGRIRAERRSCARFANLLPGLSYRRDGLPALALPQRQGLRVTQMVTREPNKIGSTRLVDGSATHQGQACFFFLSFSTVLRQKKRKSETEGHTGRAEAGPPGAGKGGFLYTSTPYPMCPSGGRKAVRTWQRRNFPKNRIRRFAICT